MEREKLDPNLVAILGTLFTIVVVLVGSILWLATRTGC